MLRTERYMIFHHLLTHFDSTFTFIIWSLTKLHVDVYLVSKKNFSVHRLTCHSVRAMLPSIFHIFHSIFHIQSSIFCSLSCDWGKSILLGILPLLLTLPSSQKMFLRFLNCLLFTDWLRVYLMSHHQVRCSRCVCLTIYVVFHTTVPFQRFTADSSWSYTI